MDKDFFNKYASAMIRTRLIKGVIPVEHKNETFKVVIDVFKAADQSIPSVYVRNSDLEGKTLFGAEVSMKGFISNRVVGGTIDDITGRVEDAMNQLIEMKELRKTLHENRDRWF